VSRQPFFFRLDYHHSLLSCFSLFSLFKSTFCIFCIFFFCIDGFLLTGCAVHTPSPCWKNGRLYGTTNDWIVCHDWDSSYRRGLSYSEGDCWEQAISQFLQAIRQRSNDQWRARSYGMILLDEYFPHRELGIVYLRVGQVENAIQELSFSLDSADSAKTKYYLNKARRRWLEKTDLDQAPPRIKFMGKFDEIEGVDGVIYTNRAIYQLKGLATDDFFVSSICINEKPILFDLALPKISFRKKVVLKSGINSICGRVFDLVGRHYEEKIKIFLDQQGPMVVFNPVDDDELSHHQTSGKRIKGLIFDAGGLHKLIIAGKEIPLVRGEKIQEFEAHIFSLNNASDFQAVDLAGNITEGDLAWMFEADEEKDLGLLDFDIEPGPRNFRHIHEAIKVCAYGPFVPICISAKMSHSSRKSPRIVVKYCPSVVFEPAVAIQGWIESSAEISDVWINNEPILSSSETAGLLNVWRRFMYGGRKVYYFTRRIEGLKEGENHLTILAEDRKGGSIQKDITVEYQVREIEKIGNRWRLAILPFMKHEIDQPSFVPQQPSSLASLDASLQYSFFQTRRFHLVERERIDAVMRELEFQVSNTLDKTASASLGTLLASEVLLMGSMQEGWDGQDRIMKVLARLVEVETGRILAIKDAYNVWKSYQDEEHLLAGLAQRFLEEFPLLQGKIVDKCRGNLELNLSAYDNIKQGMKVLVYRPQRKRKQNILGEGRVEEVAKDYSRILPSPKGLMNKVRIGDLVITK